MQLAGYDPWFLAKRPIRSLRGWWTGRLAAFGFVAAIVTSIVGTGMSAHSEQLIAIAAALGSSVLGESIYGLMNWPVPGKPNVQVASLQIRACTRAVAAVATGIFAGGALKGLGATDAVRILSTIAIAVSLLQTVTGERLVIANKKLQSTASGSRAYKDAVRARWDAYFGVIAQAQLAALLVSAALTALILQVLRPGVFTVVFLVLWLPFVVLVVVGLSIHAAEIDHLP
jgi:hypothetical protein